MVWKENTDSEIQKNYTEKIKNSGNNANSTNVEFSQNLVKVFERRYKEIDVWPQVKQYLNLCLKFENNNQNSKYCLLYILKTHK